ncbi:metallophosphoesterase [Pseudoalteromonas xiamenensis]
MTWFNEVLRIDKPHAAIAHITDAHLFATTEGRYFDVDTAHHFSQVLARLSLEDIDAVVFGGDLTQDHTFESYRLFAELILQSNLTCPVLWVPGNHDDIEYLQEISVGQIHAAKVIQTQTQQVLLANSKGSTPAGWCKQTHLLELKTMIEAFEGTSTVICHHHPMPIHGYLDKHILENGPALLNLCAESNRVNALVHGHVHNDYFLSYRELPVYATPATSIQFSRHSSTWQQQNLGPAYRLLALTDNKFATWVKWV